MPNVVTTVPAVLTKLVQLGTATLAAQNITAWLGPAPAGELGDYLSIGFSRDEDEAGVDGTTTDDGNRISSESYTVHCLLSLATGDVDPAAVAALLARADTAWTAWAGALRGDPTLGGVLTAGGMAVAGSWSWVFGPSAEGGVYAEVDHDVEVSAGYLGAA